MNEPKPASFTDIAFETGVIAERERIIKLLVEKHLSVKSEIGDHNASTLENAIALIKGENNG